MGWLRDLMVSSPGRVGGFDHLARLCLESGSWPAVARMGHRSLGAILGKLDREESMDWLGARPAVQGELGRILGVERSTIEAALRGGRVGEPSRLVTLDALPFARGLDLLEEDLFPGIPPDVLHPGGYDRLIWLCPSGGGRSLVRKMLEARGLATATELLGEDVGSPSERRPLFLDLESAKGLDLSRVAPGVCVALPDATDERTLRSMARAPSVRVVRSPPVDAILERLAAWARARLSAASDWDPRAMAQGLRDPVARGLARSAGDVLGLIGLADSVGLGAFTSGPLERLARQWLKRRASERLDRDSPVTGWMKSAGYDAFVDVVRRTATDGGDPLSSARTFEGWAALVPAELQNEMDLEWLKVALARAEPTLRAVDLERVTSELPPGAFRILRAFETVGVLERRTDDRSVLRPHWLVRVALAQAIESIVAGPAFDWGEALLTPLLAPRTMAGLHARARAGTLSGDEAIDPDPSGDPATSASTEGAVRALGIARLVAGDAGEPPEALWDEQLRLAVDLADGVPSPRWDHEPAEGGLGAWLLTRGAFHLALLSLGELLPAGVGKRHPLLRPWLETAAPKGLSAVLDHVLAALERHDAPEELIGPAVALVGRLRGVLGPLGANGAPHRLERAVVVADEVALGVLTLPSVLALDGDRVAALGLAELARRRGLEPRALAGAVFSALEAAEAPPEVARVVLQPGLAELLVPFAPVSTLARLASELARPSAPSLGDQRWAELVAAGAPVSEAVARRVPVVALDAAVAQADDAALGVLWERFGRRLHELSLALLRGHDAVRSAKLDAILAAAPSSAWRELVHALDDVDALLRAPGPSLMALRRQLYGRLTVADPGFRDTYALFDELERRCAKIPPG